MPDVGLDRLLREEEALTDLAIHETVGDELKNLDLPRGRVLPRLPLRRRAERDDRTVPAGAAASRGRLESAAVVAVAVEDLLALGSVHVSGIGGRPEASLGPPASYRSNGEGARKR